MVAFVGGFAMDELFLLVAVKCVAIQCLYVYCD